jgi:Uma2 family endonuclease
VSTITGLMTVDEYEAKVASGEIPEDSRVELIEGRLVRKVTKNPPHTYSIYAVRDAISALLPRGWHVRQEGPVRVPPLSEPEPDISVVRGTAKTYKKRHPDPVEIALIVEVADSSLADDRALAVTYGAAGIPVYWIVNLRDRQVEVYTDPDPGPHVSGVGGYRSRVDYQPGQDVPVVIDGQEVGRIAVADLLP